MASNNLQLPKTYCHAPDPSLKAISVTKCRWPSHQGQNLTKIHPKSDELEGTPSSSGTLTCIIHPWRGHMPTLNPNIRYPTELVLILQRYKPNQIFTSLIIPHHMLIKHTDVVIQPKQRLATPSYMILLSPSTLTKRYYPHSTTLRRLKGGKTS